MTVIEKKKTSFFFYLQYAILISGYLGYTVYQPSSFLIIFYEHHVMTVWYITENAHSGLMAGEGSSEGDTVIDARICCLLAAEAVFGPLTVGHKGR